MTDTSVINSIKNEQKDEKESDDTVLASMNGINIDNSNSGSIGRQNTLGSTNSITQNNSITTSTPTTPNQSSTTLLAGGSLGLLSKDIPVGMSSKSVATRFIINSIEKNSKPKDYNEIILETFNNDTDTESESEDQYHSGRKVDFWKKDYNDIKWRCHWLDLQIRDLQYQSSLCDHVFLKFNKLKRRTVPSYEEKEYEEDNENDQMLPKVASITKNSNTVKSPPPLPTPLIPEPIQDDNNNNNSTKTTTTTKSTKMVEQINDNITIEHLGEQPTHFWKDQSAKKPSKLVPLKGIITREPGLSAANSSVRTAGLSKNKKPKKLFRRPTIRVKSKQMQNELETHPLFTFHKGYFKFENTCKNLLATKSNADELTSTATTTTTDENGNQVVPQPPPLTSKQKEKKRQEELRLKFQSDDDGIIDIISLNNVKKQTRKESIEDKVKKKEIELQKREKEKADREKQRQKEKERKRASASKSGKKSTTTSTSKSSSKSKKKTTSSSLKSPQKSSSKSSSGSNSLKSTSGSKHGTPKSTSKKHSHSHLTSPIASLENFVFAPTSSQSNPIPSNYNEIVTPEWREVNTNLPATPFNYNIQCGSNLSLPSPLLLSSEYEQAQSHLTKIHNQLSLPKLDDSGNQKLGSKEYGQYKTINEHEGQNGYGDQSMQNVGDNDQLLFEDDEDDNDDDDDTITQRHALQELEERRKYHHLIMTSAAQSISSTSRRKKDLLPKDFTITVDELIPSYQFNKQQDMKLLGETWYGPVYNEDSESDESDYEEQYSDEEDYDEDEEDDESYENESNANTDVESGDESNANSDADQSDVDSDVDIKKSTGSTSKLNSSTSSINNKHLQSPPLKPTQFSPKTSKKSAPRLSRSTSSTPIKKPATTTPTSPPPPTSRQQASRQKSLPNLFNFTPTPSPSLAISKRKKRTLSTVNSIDEPPKEEEDDLEGDTQMTDTKTNGWWNDHEYKWESVKTDPINPNILRFKRIKNDTNDDNDNNNNNHVDK